MRKGEKRGLQLHVGLGHAFELKLAQRKERKKEHFFGLLVETEHHARDALGAVGGALDAGGAAGVALFAGLFEIGRGVDFGEVAALALETENAHRERVSVAETNLAFLDEDGAANAEVLDRHQRDGGGHQEVVTGTVAGTSEAQILHTIVGVTDDLRLRRGLRSRSHRRTWCIWTRNWCRRSHNRGRIF